MTLLCKGCSIKQYDKYIFWALSRDFLHVLQGEEGGGEREDIATWD